MKPNICTHFLKGHCKFKNFCRKSHNILTCKFGRSCNFPSCPFRHPPDCKNFLLNQCGFQSKDNIFVPYSFCNHYHPPPDLLYTPPILQPPYHPPSGLPHGTCHRPPQEAAASIPAMQPDPPPPPHYHPPILPTRPAPPPPILQPPKDPGWGEPGSHENNKQKASITGLQSKLLVFEVELEAYRGRAYQDKQTNTKLTNFLLMAEQWQTTLNDLTTSTQGLVVANQGD